MAEFINIQTLVVPTNGNLAIAVDYATDEIQCDVQSFRLTGATNPVVLLGNVTIAASGTPVLNQKVTFYNECNITLGAFSVTVMGVTMPTSLATKNYKAEFIWDGSVWQGGFEGYLNEDGWLQGTDIEDATITLAKLVNLTSAQVIVGNGSNIPTAVAVSGVIILTNAGVTGYTALSITNAAISASANITRTKNAKGTADYVIINDGTGDFSQEAQLAALRGGNGIDNSAATGFPIWAAGVQTVTTLTDVARIDNVSFVTANQGIYYIYFPFACTVTNLNVRVTSVIAATDAGTLTIQNNAGTAMTGNNLTAGVLTVATSAAFGTSYTSTLLTNNTFTAGQNMLITSAKTTSGGVVHIDVTYTRTTLV